MIYKYRYIFTIKYIIMSNIINEKLELKKYSENYTKNHKKFTRNYLQETYKDLCLKKSGNKKELLERIIRKLDGESLEGDLPIEKSKSTSKRKNVENNGFELIFTILILDETIINKKDILNINIDDIKNKLDGCSETEFEKYKKDIEKRTDKEIDNYILNFIKFFPSKYKSENIEKVFLEGKKIKSKEILELNKGINQKKAKADVYIKLKSGDYIGFSVKQNNQATKSNYSVEKILTKYKIINTLRNDRKDLLKKLGITSKNYKKNREIINKLFYDSLTHPYWINLREILKNNNNLIKNELVNNLFPKDLPYKLLEFDGEKFKDLNINTNECIFYEDENYYICKNGNNRKCAKMFYKLELDNLKYRIEIRWKGNILNKSSQFLCHEIKH